MEYTLSNAMLGYAFLTSIDRSVKSRGIVLGILFLRSPILFIVVGFFHDTS